MAKPAPKTPHIHLTWAAEDIAPAGTRHGRVSLRGEMDFGVLREREFRLVFCAHGVSVFAMGCESAFTL